jgi:hypothetical protein
MNRPRALVVEPDRLRQRRRAVLLRAAGFSVVSTRRVPAAMAYCNLVSPEIVVASPSAARLLMGCYPDGPFWIRALREDDLTVLRQPQVDPRIVARAIEALHCAEAA